MECFRPSSSSINSFVFRLAVLWTVRKCFLQVVGFFEVCRPLFVARQVMVLHDSMAVTVQFFFSCCDSNQSKTHVSLWIGCWQRGVFDRLSSSTQMRCPFTPRIATPLHSMTTFFPFFYRLVGFRQLTRQNVQVVLTTNYRWKQLQ